MLIRDNKKLELSNFDIESVKDIIKKNSENNMIEDSLLNAIIYILYSMKFEDKDYRDIICYLIELTQFKEDYLTSKIQLLKLKNTKFFNKKEYNEKINNTIKDIILSYKDKEDNFFLNEKGELTDNLLKKIVKAFPNHISFVLIQSKDIEIYQNLYPSAFGYRLNYFTAERADKAIHADAFRAELISASEEKKINFLVNNNEIYNFCITYRLKDFFNLVLTIKILRLLEEKLSIKIEDKNELILEIMINFQSVLNSEKDRVLLNQKKMHIRRN